MNNATQEQIDAAKELLWKYIDEANKGLLILCATTDSLKDNGLELKQINVSYQYK